MALPRSLFLLPHSTLSLFPSLPFIPHSLSTLYTHRHPLHQNAPSNNTHTSSLPSLEMSGRKSSHGTGNGAGHGSIRERMSNSRAAASNTPTNDQQQHQQQLQQEQEQELNTVSEIDNATHIVVEHHRTGTVKTHVYCSKDGKPSLLGHEISGTTTIAKNR